MIKNVDYINKMRPVKNHMSINAPKSKLMVLSTKHNSTQISSCIYIHDSDIHITISEHLLYATLSSTLSGKLEHNATRAMSTVVMVT